MFSRLGGIHALFFSVVNMFAPVGMLYFLFNLSFYIKKKKHDIYMSTIIDLNRTLYSKMQDFKNEKMFVQS